MKLKILNFKLKITRRLRERESSEPLNSGEAGVTLLLAILIMAGLVLSALAIGSFAIQELRASRAVTISEPAISAAETAGEQGLWLIKRKDHNDPSQLIKCTTGQTNYILSNNTRINSCKAYGSAIIIIPGGTDVVFYLYDPDNINGNVNLASYPYNWFSLTHKLGDAVVSITIERLDRIGQPPPLATQDVDPATTQTINLPAAAPGSEGRMKVTLYSTDNATVDVNTNQGIPTFPIIDSIACSSRTPIGSCDNTSQELYTRRIHVNVSE